LTYRHKARPEHAAFLIVSCVNPAEGLQQFVRPSELAY
jgi:hypothetical protein